MPFFMFSHYKSMAIIVLIRLEQKNNMSDVMKKPVYAICEQQRRRSAWASMQSDHRLFCSLLR